MRKPTARDTGKRRSSARPWLLPVLGTGVVVALVIGGVYARQSLRQTVAVERLHTEGEGDAEPHGPSAPPPNDPDAEARAICEERLDRYQGGEDLFNVRLLASYPSSSGEVAAEEERRKGGDFRSPSRDRPPDEFVAHCFFEADAFGLPRPPEEGREIPPGAPTRLEEVVRTDGMPYVLRAGRSEVKPSPMPRRGGS